MAQFRNQMFCSLACYHASVRPAVNEKQCEMCGATYHRNPAVAGPQFAASRFCSRRCSSHAKPVSPAKYISVRVDGKRLLAHRHVMQQQLGRQLRPGESVHHINGDRHDNRPENLELWATWHKPGQRVSDLVAFVVANYPEEVQAALACRQCGLKEGA